MKKFTFITVIVLLAALLTFSIVACTNNNPTDNNNPIEKDDPIDNNGSNDKTDPSLKDFKGITFNDLTVEFDGKEHEITCDGVPDEASVSYNNNKATDVGVYEATAEITQSGYNTLKLNAKLTITMALSAQEIVNARKAVAQAELQNYDFKINLEGSVAIGTFNGAINANYDGAYRYNSSNNDLNFKRVTSGALLYDSTEYISNTGSSKIKIVTNDKGEVKKTLVIAQEDEELNLLNLPFVAIVDHMDVDNLNNITIIEQGTYRYKATLVLTSDNVYLQKLIASIGNMGTSIDMGDVSISNPASGIDFYFNLSDDMSKLNDFMFSASVNFPIKNQQVTLKLTYEQKANDSTINMPSISGFITDASAMTNELSIINNALSNLKKSNTYSLDFEATNKFNPGWNITATADKYYSRMYKNTNNERVDFNHSFEYKVHTVDDGGETYKYTYGNIQDGTVHLVSRKGSNTVTQVNGITVDTQFDYMVNAAMVNANDIDCIKKTTKNGNTVYQIYLKKANTLSIKDKITDIINSNKAEGIIPVDNCFNANKNIIDDSVMIVEMNKNNLVSINIDTKIKYYPIGGEYTEQQITLTNSIVLKVNAELDKAAKYTAPTSATNNITGLNSPTKYIR